MVLVASAFVWLYHDLRWGVDNDSFAWDFLGTLWDPAEEIRAGRSPYPAPLVTQVDIGNPTYYPPLLMLVVLPLTLLPWEVGALIWTGLLAGSVLATLFILGVRDVRCYLIAVVTAPVTLGLIYANATLLLLPFVALAWRYRERWVVSGGLIGIAIAAKLFVWPLVLWELGTRRYRAAATSVGVCAAAVLLPWAAIGFDGLLAYPDLARVAQDLYAFQGSSLAAALGALGVEKDAAVLGCFVIGGLVGVVAFGLGRLGRDEASLFVAILAALVASPIVWEHYYALLLVPLAIASPRLSALWILLPVIHFARVLPRPRLSAADIEPGGIACCPPDGVPISSWVVGHASPALWPALASLVIATMVVGLSAWRMRSRRLRLRHRLQEPART